MLGPLIHKYGSNERFQLSMALQLKATDLVARQLKQTCFFVHSITPQLCKWIIWHWYYHWDTEDLSISVPIMEPESENNSIAVMEVLCHWNQHITHLCKSIIKMLITISQQEMASIWCIRWKFSSPGMTCCVLCYIVLPTSSSGWTLRNLLPVSQGSTVQHWRWCLQVPQPHSNVSYFRRQYSRHTLP